MDHDIADEAIAAQHVADLRITDLLVRYWGLGKSLSEDEKEVLLVALDEENKLLRGPIHVRALDRLKEKGIG
jgi:hypothetical protein